MRRKIVHPYGQSGAHMRIISMLMAALVLYMLYERLKDPATWRALADDKESRTSAPAPVHAPDPDNGPVIVGPNDLDVEELAAIQEEFEGIIDQTPLMPRDMDAYWRLMKWSRTQSLADMEKRGRDDIPFAQLFEQPEKYRGELIYLRLHVRRVQPYESTTYPDGIKQVWEAWGWTDESLSFPYVVAMPDPSENIPRGADVRAEVVFTGYFLKIMIYRAFDHWRKVPLLIGRARLVSVPKPVPAKTDPWTIIFVVIGATVFIGWFVWFNMKSRKKSKIKMLPKELSVEPIAEEPNFDNFPGPKDTNGSQNQSRFESPFAFLKGETSPATVPRTTLQVSENRTAESHRRQPSPAATSGPLPGTRRPSLAKRWAPRRLPSSQQVFKTYRPRPPKSHSTNS